MKFRFHCKQTFTGTRAHQSISVLCGCFCTTMVEQPAESLESAEIIPLWSLQGQTSACPCVPLLSLQYFQKVAFPLPLYLYIRPGGQ